MPNSRTRSDPDRKRVPIACLGKSVNWSAYRGEGGEKGGD